MNEYQSMELYHGAAYSYYESYVDGWPDNIPAWSEPPHTTGLNGAPIKQFNESAIDGGRIAFVDDEDISFYENKLKYVEPDKIVDEEGNFQFGGYGGAYGPPVEVDSKYLNMLLNAKKLKTSLSSNISIQDPFGLSYNIQGVIEGSFDSLTGFLYTQNEPEITNKHFVTSYRRDTTSKAAQLDSVSEHMLPSIYFSVDLYAKRLYDNENNPLPIPPIDYTVNEDRGKLGSFSLNYHVEIVEGESAGFSSIQCFVGFIVVTPTKVYVFPYIYGTNYTTVNEITFTAVKQNNYIALDMGTSSYPYSYSRVPPLATSQITFLGVQVPVYSIPSVVYNGEADAGLTGACGGTSFDISIEEEY